MSIDKKELRRVVMAAIKEGLEPGDRWALNIDPFSIMAVLDELLARELQVDTLTEWYSNSLDQLGAVSAAIPGVLYMDMPDGGSVTLGEQVSRMAAKISDLERQISEYRNGVS